MLAQREITVGGQQYVIETLTSSEGMEAAITIAHIMQGALKGIGDTKGDILDTPINFGEIASGLLERMDEKRTPAFLKWLVTKSVVKPMMTSDLFESTFAGSYDDLWELVEKIIEHNSFGSVLKKRLAPLIKQLFSAGAATGQDSIPSTPGS